MSTDRDRAGTSPQSFAIGSLFLWAPEN